MGPQAAAVVATQVEGTEKSEFASVSRMKALWEFKQLEEPDSKPPNKEAAELCKSALLHFTSDEDVTPMGFSPAGTSVSSSAVHSAESPVATAVAPVTPAQKTVDEPRTCSAHDDEGVAAAVAPLPSAQNTVDGPMDADAHAVEKAL